MFPWFIPVMEGPVVAGVAAFQAWSMPFIWSISGCWAASIRAARSLTWGELARCAASLDISTAWVWCGIMLCRKVMSAWLWAWLAEAELLVAAGAGVVPAGPASEPELHPASIAPTVRVAIVAAILVATV